MLNYWTVRYCLPVQTTVLIRRVPGNPPGSAKHRNGWLPLNSSTLNPISPDQARAGAGESDSIIPISPRSVKRSNSASSSHFVLLLQNYTTATLPPAATGHGQATQYTREVCQEVNLLSSSSRQCTMGTKFCHQISLFIDHYRPGV